MSLPVPVSTVLMRSVSVRSMLSSLQSKYDGEVRAGIASCNRCILTAFRNAKCLQLYASCDHCADCCLPLSEASVRWRYACTF